jgi:hypothetical protein
MCRGHQLVTTGHRIEAHYLACQRGWRFSMNASGPSVASWLVIRRASRGAAGRGHVGVPVGPTAGYRASAADRAVGRGHFRATRARARLGGPSDSRHHPTPYPRPRPRRRRPRPPARNSRSDGSCCSTPRRAASKRHSGYTSAPATVSCADNEPRRRDYTSRNGSRWDRADDPSPDYTDTTDRTGP